MTFESVLLAKFGRTIRQQQLFHPGDTLIVGISGGADSTALLDLLVRLPVYNLHLIAAHLNHSLRAAESDADEEFCRRLAAGYGVPFENRRVDVKASAELLGLNLEDAARRVRIGFLDEVRNKYSAAAVALAHHSDDQAETVLMRLLRGSGMTGLSAMVFRNARGYVRPLLEINRAEIEMYLRACGLSWREDSSNSDTTYLRNRIRHELLPLLEGYNPAIRTSLATTASILGGDEALLEGLTKEAFAGACRVVEERVDCDVEILCKLRPALRCRVLRHAFKEQAGNLEGLSIRHVEALCDMLASDRPNARLSLPQQITAVRAYGQMSLTHAAEELSGADFNLQISGPGCFKLPGGGSLVVELPDTTAVSADSITALFGLDKLPFPWHVRSFRPGDRIRPFGMSGRKKVKDIFIDRKIPTSERRRMPLLFCGDDLIWVAGLCVSELSRIDLNTAPVVRVTWFNSADKSL